MVALQYDVIKVVVFFVLLVVTALVEHHFQQRWRVERKRPPFKTVLLRITYFMSSLVFQAMMLALTCWYLIKIWFLY